MSGVASRANETLSSYVEYLERSLGGRVGYLEDWRQWAENKFTQLSDQYKDLKTKVERIILRLGNVERQTEDENNAKTIEKLRSEIEAMKEAMKDMKEELKDTKEKLEQRVEKMKEEMKKTMERLDSFEQRVANLETQQQQIQQMLLQNQQRQPMYQ